MNRSRLRSRSLLARALPTLTIGIVAVTSGCSSRGAGTSSGEGTDDNDHLPASGGAAGMPSAPGVVNIDLGDGVGTGGIIDDGTPGDVENGECDQVNIASMRKPVSMILVLDRSRSMIGHNTLDGITRWAAIVPAVTGTVEATNLGINWGLKLYPEGQDTGSCTPPSLSETIHVPIAMANASVVNAAIGATEALGDGTPTGGAIKTASEYLATLGDETQKYILLATDGEPSCAPDSEDPKDYAVQEISAAVAAGFPTFVIGVLSGSGSAAETLNRMAVAGGRPKMGDAGGYQFYLAESQDALVSALEEITGQIASCVFSFDAAPPDPSNIAVKVDGVLIEPGPTGWMYTGDEHLAIALQGAVCDQVRDAESAQIDIIFGCPGQVIR